MTRRNNAEEEEEEEEEEPGREVKRVLRVCIPERWRYTF